jgi:hypothetical protein
MEENKSLVRRRPRVSAAQVSQLVERYRASGLTQREFAASVNVGYSTFTGWLHRRRRSPPKQDLPWVPVDVVKPAASAGARRYQLELPNGARLSVSGGFDAQETEHLLQLLSACSA